MWRIGASWVPQRRIAKTTLSCHDFVTIRKLHSTRCINVHHWVEVMLVPNQLELKPFLFGEFFLRSSNSSFWNPLICKFIEMVKKQIYKAEISSKSPNHHGCCAPKLSNSKVMSENLFNYLNSDYWKITQPIVSIFIK